MNGELGGTRRRMWRRAVLVWAITVAVGGGLTLWLQDSTRPRPPVGWERENPSEPAAPLLKATACPIDEGATAYACVYAWPTP
ncbi:MULTISPECIES: hypothetical protein [unclassified Streptomyces]|uniref:hypothetical protein n=1 Tax=unclassified Streptomyces TaxID=2593676 RepID=UPI0022539F5E|nr:MULTISPECIES: hypothetical protein [unclassified Streptomyces]MCX4883519.1 hypothetical protein [Streptomyces sp. NBC_00847]MCX5423551.1 hypothetical protein [Streptomyces sp. NBC_00078]